MSIGTLYSYPQNPRSLKAHIAAKYVGKSVEEPVFDFPAGLQTDEMKELFPMAKIPVFKTECGKPIFESNAIAYYVAAQDESVGLLGATAYEKALVQTFMSFADNEINPHLATLLYPILGYYKFDKDAHTAAASSLRRSLNALEKWLITRTYVASEQVTIADIVLFCTMIPLYKMYLDTITRAPFVNVNRWFNTILNQPNVAAIVTDFEYCEKAVVYDPAVHKYKFGPQEDKPAAAATTTAAAAAAPAADGKEKNPLDLLPPSPFVLDAWKRFYSNNSEVDSIKYFWENVDLEGYSLWLASYMDNHLLKQTFMTCNLINGLFQRSDRARKYAFGSFAIFGEDNDSELFAIYLVRGQEIPFELADAPDFESYVTKKLEINDETKALVNAFLTWDDSIEGCSFASITNKKFNEGKIFK